MKAWIFPGQGSQFVGMGAELFERYPDEVCAADEILGTSILQLCLDDPEGKLGDTRWTQPALYVVNALARRAKLDLGEPAPDAVAGHSLGEYNALLAADVFDFEDGLRLVSARGELLGRARDGGMAAVFGCGDEELSDLLADAGLGAVEIANFNSDRQLVVSGPRGAVDATVGLLAALGISCVPLGNVAAAFHSKAMAPFVAPFREVLATVRFRPPRLPVIANVTARPHEQSAIADLLARQLAEPVRWTESVRHLAALGMTTFEEVGPGQVLTKLVRSIRRPRFEVPRSVTEVGPEAAAADRLGAASFRRAHRVRRPYVASALARGVSSKEWVVALAKAGTLGIFGAEGLDLATIERTLRAIRRELDGEVFGASLAASPDDPATEDARIDLYLRSGVEVVEAIDFWTPSPALVRYRLRGLSRARDGSLRVRHRVVARVARRDAAEIFLAPPPESVVELLLGAGLVTAQEAALSRMIPLAEDVCLASSFESGVGVGIDGLAIGLPSLLRLRDAAVARFCFEVDVRIGLGEGIGTPEAAAAAFFLGADFVATGALNAATIEAATSDAAKDLLVAAGIEDAVLAPAAELFALGAKARVLGRGTLFPRRAERLVEVWRRHRAWAAIDEPTRRRIERESFGRSYEDALAAARRRYGTAETSGGNGEAGAADFELVVRWAFERASDLAREGDERERLNFQIPFDPALGAANEAFRGTPLESWRSRHVSELADRLLEGAVTFLERRSLAKNDKGPMSD